MKSRAQRAWMWTNNPKMAAEFEASTPKGKKLPLRVKKKPKPKVKRRTKKKK